MLKVTALSKEQAENCPIRSVLSKVTGKWQLLILLVLSSGPQRFGALKRLIGDITQRVLTENLRNLERDGHLLRTVHAGPPLAVTYTLTEQGQDLVGVLKPLVIWADNNFPSIQASRQEVDNA
ncbi:helix-turn-helix transcriptional regulator [Shimia sp. CNT1-13L.2]|uniref:winged helix-turn-helix transcriptional regulator n=1 Tax=Shimia sp. CNT1-13L.2 TaxID=2959663 RepID=UPI0020CF675F|nr:helix-turn-helix domain-containing protein [Shimia sp. CNT1-13L.2]MCP9483790.1 helix-turn-helix transcriptional regulator [Shimia sp. CNT1-13L.2]